MPKTKRLLLTQITAFSGLALFLVILSKVTTLDYLYGVSADMEAIDYSSDCVRPEYYQGYISRNRIDEDGDMMADSWERTYELNYNDPSDGALDPDGDGYTNLEEYQADSDPRSARYYPGVIVVTKRGFDCFYTAEMGYFGDDELLDILIRDPSLNYVPAIREFVMIQQADNSFEIEDAQDYEWPELVSIQSALVLAELNGDMSKDIALIGLSDIIPGVNDQIVFADGGGDLIVRGSNIDAIPYSIKELTPQNVSFFFELNQWINDQNYFENNAAVVASVPEIVELSWLMDGVGGTLRGLQSFPPDSFSDGCSERLTRCYSVLADENDPSNGPPESILSIEYLPSPYEIGVIDKENDPEVPDSYYFVKAVYGEASNVEVKDFSAFNQEALALSRAEFKNVRESGVMYVPSDEANVIYRVLRDQLGSVILPLSYAIPEGAHFYFDVEYEHLGEAGILGSIQGILDSTSNYFVRAPEIYFSVPEPN